MAATPAARPNHRSGRPRNRPKDHRPPAPCETACHKKYSAYLLAAMSATSVTTSASGSFSAVSQFEAVDDAVHGLIVGDEGYDHHRSDVVGAKKGLTFYLSLAPTNVDVFLRNRGEFFPGFCRPPLEIVLCSSLAHFLIFCPGCAGHLSSSSSGAKRSLPGAVPSF